jgi:predicted acyltransferase
MNTDSPSTPAPSPRLMSLDALRGFDMFWIMGGDALAATLHKVGKDRVTEGIATQLEHVEWAGFHFYDLIFPLFVFIVGVSLVFSLRRTIEREGRAAALKRVFWRTLLLFVVGLFYSGGFASRWPDIRLLGVLNRIALCYGFTGLIFCCVGWRGMAVICVGLLAGYWALMTFVSFPDLRRVNDAGELLSPAMNITNAANTAELNWATTNRVRGVLEPGLNLANYIDQRLLPGKKWDKTWDPEGLLSTLPAIATCLLGVFAGLWLQNQSAGDRRKVAWLLAAGALTAGAGFAWGIQFPVVKKIWTSSFVLVAGGFSAMLLGLFHWVVEVRQWRRWCQPFVWYGMNPITVYLADNIIGFRKVATRLLGGEVQAWLNGHVAAGCGDLFLALGEVGIGLCLVWWLYRRKIFLRL